MYDRYRAYVVQCPWKAGVVSEAWAGLGAHPVVKVEGVDIASEGSRRVSIPAADVATAQAILHYTSWTRVPSGDPGGAPAPTTTGAPTSTSVPATSTPIGPAPDSSIAVPAARAKVRSPVKFSGSATDPSGVVAVRVAVRKPATGQWLQPDGSFGPAFKQFEATLNAKGAVSTAWSWTTTLKPGSYGLSVRAVGLPAVVEPTAAWVDFTVLA